jgi:hypothetical protein
MVAEAPVLIHPAEYALMGSKTTETTETTSLLRLVTTQAVILPMQSHPFDKEISLLPQLASPRHGTPRLGHGMTYQHVTPGQSVKFPRPGTLVTAQTTSV